MQKLVLISRRFVSTDRISCELSLSIVEHLKEMFGGPRAGLAVLTVKVGLKVDHFP